jgi:hypothetical protein
MKNMNWKFVNGFNLCKKKKQGEMVQVFIKHHPKLFATKNCTASKLKVQKQSEADILHTGIHMLFPCYSSTYGMRQLVSGRRNCVWGSEHM